MTSRAERSPGPAGPKRARARAAALAPLVLLPLLACGPASPAAEPESRTFTELRARVVPDLKPGTPVEAWLVPEHGGELVRDELWREPTADGGVRLAATFVEPPWGVWTLRIELVRSESGAIRARASGLRNFGSRPVFRGTLEDFTGEIELSGDEWGPGHPLRVSFDLEATLVAEWVPGTGPEPRDGPRSERLERLRGTLDFGAE